ncbi:MAG: DUF2946 family protein [Pirellulales bacterium]
MKNASVWAFSALFGCISLFGPGWHCFVGHQFHASRTWLGECGHHDHALVGDAGHSDDDGQQGARWANAHQDDDCPICKFFAQAQWAFAIRPAEFEIAASEFISPAEQAFWVACVGLYHSRAPPG